MGEDFKRDKTESEPNYQTLPSGNTKSSFYCGGGPKKRFIFIKVFVKTRKWRKGHYEELLFDAQNKKQIKLMLKALK